MKVLCHYSLSEGLADEIGKQCDPEVELVFCAEDDRIRFNALLTLDVIWHVLKPITAQHIAQAPKLRLIQKLGVGMRCLDQALSNVRRLARDEHLHNRLGSKPINFAAAAIQS